MTPRNWKKKCPDKVLPTNLMENFQYKIIISCRFFIFGVVSFSWNSFFYQIYFLWYERDLTAIFYLLKRNVCLAFVTPSYCKCVDIKNAISIYTIWDQKLFLLLCTYNYVCMYLFIGLEKCISTVSAFTTPPSIKCRIHVGILYPTDPFFTQNTWTLVRTFTIFIPTKLPTEKKVCISSHIT